MTLYGLSRSIYRVARVQSAARNPGPLCPESAQEPRATSGRVLVALAPLVAGRRDRAHFERRERAGLDGSVPDRERGGRNRNEEGAR